MCQLQVNILRMYRQLELFQEYKRRLSALTGSRQAHQLVNQSLFLITVGGNDFVNNYYLVPYSARSRQYKLPDYVKFLISEYRRLLMVFSFSFFFPDNFSCPDLHLCHQLAVTNVLKIVDIISSLSEGGTKLKLHQAHVSCLALQTSKHHSVSALTLVVALFGSLLV